MAETQDTEQPIPSEGPPIEYDQVTIFVPGQDKPRVFLKEKVKGFYLNMVQVVDDEGDLLTFIGFPALFEKLNSKPKK
jgi:hypothetical protein